MKEIMTSGGIPPATLSELQDFLYRTRSTFGPADAIAAAVKQWIASERAAVESARGYQWKQLFLPAGTRVRMQCGEQWHYADVVDDRLLYDERPLSPHQLVEAVAGPGRNAWRELWLRRPGDKFWLQADRLRSQLAQGMVSANPPSPMEAMRSAAQGMRHALQSALTLVEHVRLEAEHAAERRIPKHRRCDDYMNDDCAAD